MIRLNIFPTIALAAALCVAVAPLQAQGRGRGKDSIPASMRPPAGMCRIWLDSVPASQQPAPTDCATAVRNRPANGRVIFGDEPGGRGSRGRTGDALRPRKLRGPSAWRVPPRDPVNDVRGYADARRRADDPDDYDDDDGYGGGPGDRAAGVPYDRDDRGRIDDRDDRAGRDRYGRLFRPGSDVCEDRNRDGRCDDAQGSGDSCLDRDRDGLCDEDYGASAGGGYYDDLADGLGYGTPSGLGRVATAAAGRRLPSMRSAALAAQGEVPADVSRWLGAQEVIARRLDSNRDGVPERVTWLTTAGQVVQVWYDRDRDGVADRVELFQNGRRVRVIGQ